MVSPKAPTALEPGQIRQAVRQAGSDLLPGIFSEVSEAYSKQYLIP